MELRFRPITTWPPDAGDPYGPYQPDRFKTSYDRTLYTLDREILHLGGDYIVLQLAIEEAGLRLDGQLRANTQPSHPGVIVAFESVHGPLKYATANFPTWRSNLRAVALGLEHLRAVDRYGITKRGEQYAGWKALPAGGNEFRAARGKVLVAEHGGDIKAAMKATHPDAGGDADDFAAVNEFKRLSGGA